MSHNKTFFPFYHRIEVQHGWCGWWTPMVRTLSTNGADGLYPCKEPITIKVGTNISVLHCGGLEYAW